jgi:hypothetical protein
MPLSLSTGRTRRFDKLRVIPVEARMSTTVTLTDSYTVQWLIESRPPSLSWSRPTPPQSNQPPLDLTDHVPDVAEAAGPDHRGIRVSIVKARWAAKQRPGLPDAREWSSPLALALTQSLVGRRPVAHPNRSKRARAGTWNLCRRGPRLRHPVLGQPCVRLSARGATNLGLVDRVAMRWSMISRGTLNSTTASKRS